MVEDKAVDEVLNIGKKIEDIICEECKAKITKLTSQMIKNKKVSVLGIIGKVRYANQMFNALCSECKNKCVNRLKK